MVIFGLPGQKHEDDPVRALKCALAIYDSLHSIQEIMYVFYFIFNLIEFRHKLSREFPFQLSLKFVLKKTQELCEKRSVFLVSFIPCSNESIGVTTGLAFTGVVGHTDRHEYTGTRCFPLE